MRASSVLKRHSILTPFSSRCSCQIHASLWRVSKSATRRWGHCRLSTESRPAPQQVSSLVFCGPAGTRLLRGGSHPLCEPPWGSGWSSGCGCQTALVLSSSGSELMGVFAEPGCLFSGSVLRALLLYLVHFPDPLVYGVGIVERDAGALRQVDGSPGVPGGATTQASTHR